MIKNKHIELYESPFSEMIEETILNTPLCASQDEGFMIEDKFEDDGTF